VTEYGPDVVLNDPAFIHPSAQIYGKVRIEEGASVWPNVVMRAENNEIVVGPHTNIQDLVMIHVGYTTPTIIGEYCSITHHCTIHGCTIGDNVLVGIGATIMDGCVIGDNSIIGGHSFLKEGTEIPPNSIVMGVPGKVVKERDNWIQNRFNALMYCRNAEAYARGHYRVWDGPEYEAWAKGEMERLTREFDARKRNAAE